MRACSLLNPNMTITTWLDHSPILQLKSPHTFHVVDDCNGILQAYMLSETLLFTVESKSYAIWFANRKEGWVLLHQMTLSDPSSIKAVLIGNLILISQKQVLNTLLLDQEKTNTASLPKVALRNQHSVHVEPPPYLACASSFLEDGIPQIQDPAETSSPKKSGQPEWFEALMDKLQSGFCPRINGGDFLLARGSEVYNWKNNELLSFSCPIDTQHLHALYDGYIFYDKGCTLWKERSTQKGDSPISETQDKSNSSVLISYSNPIVDCEPIYPVSFGMLSQNKASKKNADYPLVQEKHPLIGFWVTLSTGELRIFFMTGESLEIPRGSRFLVATQPYLFYSSPTNQLHRMNLFDQQVSTIRVEPAGLLTYIPNSLFPFKFLILHNKKDANHSASSHGKDPSLSPIPDACSMS